jgi:hypothetical protein
MCTTSILVAQAAGLGQPVNSSHYVERPTSTSKNTAAGQKSKAC